VAERLVKFSDLTNTMIEPGTPYARLVVERHSELAPGSRVSLDCLPSELKGVDDVEIDLVLLTIYEDGRDPRKVALQREDFDALARGDDDMSTLIANGVQPVKPEPERSRSRARAERVDYSLVEHAGRPHRGATTDAEKETVRANLDAVNERLAREGHRQIDLADAEHVERYGLAELAEERGVGISRESGRA
jgi:hypothetical protein